MKPNPLFFAFLSGLVLQIACGERQTSPPASSEKPVAVSVLRVEYNSIPAVVQVPGTVQPRNRIALSSQINGFVRDMQVRVGDSVRQDQVLAILDARDAESQKAAAQASIHEAQASLSEAQKAYQAAVDMQAASKASAELADQTYARYQKLFESRSVSPQEMDEVQMRRSASAAELASRESMVAAAQERIKQVEARIAQAKAQAGRADVMMSWTEIKAPAPGKIVERSADTGTAIFPGSPLLVIESTANPQVLADLPTEHLNHLSVGKSVRILSGETLAVHEGRVAEIVPLSDPSTHSVQFKVNLPSNLTLPNGQFVKVEVPVGTRNAMLIPDQAIRTTGQLNGLFVVDAGSKAHFRLAKTVPYDADRSEVLSGVEPGETIIARLNNQIEDGIPVETKP
jgi:multidrug efflux pump subunit AcrA (membrane-fusion protein)